MVERKFTERVPFLVTFRLGIIKGFVIRASFLRGNVQHERKTRKSFVAPRKRLPRITKSLSLPSQKVPAGLGG